MDLLSFVFLLVVYGPFCLLRAQTVVICQDKDPQCSKYTAEHCSVYPHIKTTCPLTCKVCEINPPFSSSLPSMTSSHVITPTQSTVVVRHTSSIAHVDGGSWKNNTTTIANARTVYNPQATVLIGVAICWLYVF